MNQDHIVTGTLVLRVHSLAIEKQSTQRKRGRRKSVPEAVELCPGQLDCTSVAMDLLHKQEKSLIALLVS